MWATAECDALKFTWASNTSIWENQWPWPAEKLVTLEQLVWVQLDKGHIPPTTSPWNTPVFVTRMPNSGKWRLLHDLRKINKVIVEMGSLQTSLPSPVMIPKDWTLTVIDLKDSFFNVSLHPDDAQQFAFSVPSINQQVPLRRSIGKFCLEACITRWLSANDLLWKYFLQFVHNIHIPSYCTTWIIS